MSLTKKAGILESPSMDPAATDVLKEELRFLTEQRQALIQQHAGEYALIKGRRLVGTFTTFEEAYDRGVAEFGREPFLIKQLVEQEPVETQPALTQNLLHAHL